jgi:hypothetical protein
MSQLSHETACGGCSSLKTPSISLAAVGTGNRTVSKKNSK